MSENGKGKISKRKKEEIERIKSAVDKKWGVNAVNYLGNKKVLSAPKFSSQCYDLDDALGGGWAIGRTIEIYGAEGSGKSTLTLHAIAEFQKKFPDDLIALIDVEFAFDPEYAQNLGVHVPELMVSQPEHGELALNIMVDLITQGVKLLIVDSVAALLPRDEFEGESVGDGALGSQARMMSKALRKLTSFAGSNGATLIFTNQTREKIGIMYGDKTTTPGGLALKFYASQRVKVNKGKKQKEGKDGDFVANTVKATVTKNKVAPPFRNSEFIIRFGEGINRFESALDFAVKKGIVELKGAWFNYGSNKLGQGKIKTLEVLKENSTLFESIEKDIANILVDKDENIEDINGRKKVDKKEKNDTDESGSVEEV